MNARSTFTSLDELDRATLSSRSYQPDEEDRKDRGTTPTQVVFAGPAWSDADEPALFPTRWPASWERWGLNE